MNKRLLAILLTLCLIIGVYALLSNFLLSKTHHDIHAIDGKLDLTDWQATAKDVIPLQGEWEFYPNSLLSSIDSNTSSEQALQPPLKIEVPGSWHSVMNITGSATYRLLLYSSDSMTTYGIKTSSIYMSNKLFLNGNEIGNSGTPGEKQSYSALNKPYVSYFTLQQGWNEIILQVSNYDFPIESGIIEPIYFGTAEQISKLRDKAMAHDWITIATFFIMGLNFLGLYYQRRSDYSWLSLGLLCIFIAIFTSTRSERLIFYILGDFSFQLSFRIQMIVSLLAVICIFSYLHIVMRKYCNKPIMYAGFILGIILSIYYLLFSAHMLSPILRNFSTVFISFTLIYATYVFILAAMYKIAGTVYLVVAAIALNIITFKQGASLYFGIPTYGLPPIEPFLFLLMLALIMSQRFTNAYNQIAKLSEELIKADKIKDDFLARTSHEFKTPLHGILHITQSILQDPMYPLHNQQQEKLQLIRSLTTRLSKLVYDILDLSKLKHNVLHISPRLVDVHAIVDAQIHIYNYMSKERNIVLENQVNRNLKPALADESRLSQIISNLLDNAIKHTQNGKVIVKAEERDSKIVISVQDTGSGIAPDRLPYIFEPFNIEDNENIEHFGLGLSIVKQLVELQNGAIEVTSTLGEGSTFTFTLPVGEALSVRNEAVFNSYPAAVSSLSNKETYQPSYFIETPYVSNPAGKQTVLVVDDQFINLKILVDALKPFDYKVIAVKNGYEALEELQDGHKVDLIILDNMMPGISGYEVCQEIRKRYSMVELPILMVTAAIQTNDKVTAFQAGANDYLPKPFDIEELKARVQSLLAMKSSFERLVGMELAFLQSQIKPHFLYNVLNTIIALSYSDVERARELIIDFADYLRGSFRFSNTDQTITFAEEYQLIQAYLKIESARFDNRITLHEEIDDEVFNLKIPPLIIQPLIENAIQHGLGNRVEGGTITLTTYQLEHEWLIVVADDGQGMNQQMIHQLLNDDLTRNTESVGLININKRLKYEYGTSLKIYSELGRGTSITLRIPKRVEAELVTPTK